MDDATDLSSNQNKNKLEEPAAGCNINKTRKNNKKNEEKIRVRAWVCVERDGGGEIFAVSLSLRGGGSTGFWYYYSILIFLYY